MVRESVVCEIVHRGGAPLRNWWMSPRFSFAELVDVPGFLPRVSANRVLYFGQVEIGPPEVTLRSKHLSGKQLRS